MRKYQAQSLVEFSLIIVLVIIVCLAGIALMGDQLKQLFDNSPHNQPASVTPPTFEIEQPVSIANTDVIFDDDNNASFSYNGQNVNLSADIINNLNEVFETSGSSGLTAEVINAIKVLIDEEGPPPVPLDISFGTGYRTESSQTFSGDATNNMATITAGTRMIIIQNDQSFQGSPNCNNQQCGVNIVDGTVSGSTFTGTVSQASNPTYQNATYQANVTGSSYTGSSLSHPDLLWDFDFTTSTQSI